MTNLWMHHTGSVRQVPFYVLLIIALWLSCAAVSTGTLLLAHKSAMPLDPFAEYQDLLPSNNLNALESYNEVYEVVCTGHNQQYSLRDYCSFKPRDGVFSLVEVFLDQQHVISELVFTVRNNALEVGDLILLWTKPTYDYQLRDYSCFVWERNSLMRSVYARYSVGANFSSPQLPILKIHFFEY